MSVVYFDGVVPPPLQAPVPSQDLCLGQKPIEARAVHYLCQVRAAWISCRTCTSSIPLHSIQGLADSSHKGDPFIVANPITPPIKNLICRVLHDLGETFIDVLLIEGPYQTEEVSVPSPGHTAFR